MMETKTENDDSVLVRSFTPSNIESKDAGIKQNADIEQSKDAQKKDTLDDYSWNELLSSVESLSEGVSDIGDYVRASPKNVDEQKIAMSSILELLNSTEFQVADINLLMKKNQEAPMPKNDNNDDKSQNKNEKQADDNNDDKSQNKNEKQTDDNNKSEYTKKQDELHTRQSELLKKQTELTNIIANSQSRKEIKNAENEKKVNDKQLKNLEKQEKLNAKEEEVKNELKVEQEKKQIRDEKEETRKSKQENSFTEQFKKELSKVKSSLTSTKSKIIASLIAVALAVISYYLPKIIPWIYKYIVPFFQKIGDFFKTVKDGINNAISYIKMIAHKLNPFKSDEEKASDEAESVQDEASSRVAYKNGLTSSALNDLIEDVKEVPIPEDKQNVGADLNPSAKGVSGMSTSDLYILLTTSGKMSPQDINNVMNKFYNGKKYKTRDDALRAYMKDHLKGSDVYETTRNTIDKSVKQGDYVNGEQVKGDDIMNFFTNNISSSSGKTETEIADLRKKIASGNYVYEDKEFNTKFSVTPEMLNAYDAAGKKTADFDETTSQAVMFSNLAPTLDEHEDLYNFNNKEYLEQHPEYKKLVEDEAKKNNISLPEAQLLVNRVMHGAVSNKNNWSNGMEWKDEKTVDPTGSGKFIMSPSVHEPTMPAADDYNFEAEYAPSKTESTNVRQNTESLEQKNKTKLSKNSDVHNEASSTVNKNETKTEVYNNTIYQQMSSPQNVISGSR